VSGYQGPVSTDNDDIVDLDAECEFSFADLRAQPVPAGRLAEFSPEWQEEQRQACRERAAAREAAAARTRSDALRRNLLDTRTRVEQRRSQPGHSGREGGAPAVTAGRTGHAGGGSG
jgi:hypothetical protein